jgi:phage shock protein C
MNKKLYRSRKERVLWGVATGLAKYFGIDPVIMRIIFVASLFVGSLGFWVYIIMTIIVLLNLNRILNLLNRPNLKTEVVNAPYVDYASGAILI